MATPAFRAAGAASSGTGAVTPGLPTGHTTNDILLCFVQTSNQNAGAVPTNATSGTWVEITNSPQGVGTAAAAGSVGLRVYWMRDAGATIGIVTVPDSGDHTIAFICAYSGCVTSGNPWDITSGNTNSTTTTTATFPTATTTRASNLIVLATANAVDSNSAWFSSVAGNGNLGSTPTNRTPASANTVSGTGGGLTVLDAPLALPGATGTPSCTGSSSANYANMTIALKTNAMATSLSGSLSFVGSITRRIARALTGILSFGGAASTLASGLQVYYKLEDLTDSSGNGLTLTDHGTVTFVAGKVNNCANFVKASTQYLTHVDDAHYQPGTGDWSFSMWVNYTGVSSGDPFIEYGKIINSFPGYNLRESSGALLATIADGTHLAFKTSAVTTNDGNWHLVIVTFARGGNLTIYIDNNAGETASIATVTGSVNDTQGFGLSIGRNINGDLFEGKIDEVLMWNRVVTGSEITELWGGGSGTTVSLTGTPNTLIKRTGKILSAALSFIGSLATFLNHVVGPTFTQAVTGTLNFAGAQVRSTGKGMSAALAFVGNITRSTTHTFAGMLSFAGAITKSIPRAFTGALSFVGAFVKSTGHKATATLSFVGSLTRSVSRALAATLSFVGSITKRTTHTFAAALSFIGALAASHRALLALTATLDFAGSITKRTSRALSGALSFVGSLTKSTAKSFGGVLAFIGALARSCRKTLAATLNFAGAIVRYVRVTLDSALSFIGDLGTFLVGGAHEFSQSFTAALEFTGTITRRTFTALAAATLSFVGSLTKRTAHSFAGALSFVGALAKSTAHSAVATLSFVGALTKSIRRSFTGALSFIGDLATHLFAGAVQYFQALTGSLSFSGATSKRTSHAFTATLSFIGSTLKRAAKMLSGVLGFSGTTSKYVFKYISGTLSFSGRCAKGMYQAFTSTLNFIGNLLTELNPAELFLMAFEATLNFSSTMRRRISVGLASVLRFIGFWRFHRLARRICRLFASGARNPGFHNPDPVAPPSRTVRTAPTEVVAPPDRSAKQPPHCR